MASTEGLMPITRAFLASYYDKYPFSPLSDDVSRLSSDMASLIKLLTVQSPPSQGETSLIDEANRQPPHKIDENMWKNREQMEEILFLLSPSRWPVQLREPSTSEDAEFASILRTLKDSFDNAFTAMISFQTKNSERIFSTDFRGTLIRQQKERSERNKQAEVDALVSSGGSIRDTYALLWKQQMERRRQLAQLGSATGVYKTLVKYLVGVPQVLLDFIRQINDDDGPMEEQRERYGPPLYSLTKMVIAIRVFLTLLWERYDTFKLSKDQMNLLSEAAIVYTSEFERFVTFISDVFANSPFFISADTAGILWSRDNEEYKEIIVQAGRTYEISLMVESENSYIAWDFSLMQGKISMLPYIRFLLLYLLLFLPDSGYLCFHTYFCCLSSVYISVVFYQDIGFSVEYINASGEKTLILPYRRYEADQGNFSTLMAGNYKLVWDNSYSTFFKKTLRYKVDCIAPVVEPDPEPEPLN
ncbi:retinal-binding protein [Arabidopsis thaliana]|uniref:Retinal-binding protein n=1 Tax=Arabidopsis thaliana TaxID=3702 RepID=F4K7W4_ARATH|nr:retinal-binding protein [Arabidopsis thaliana]AED90285.1 retinal-binding protein [Arabidopsis thaliana]|eukprot:NP_001318448.1 retinal-binding protein [Arabidopsis thaliana]